MVLQVVLRSAVLVIIRVIGLKIDYSCEDGRCDSSSGVIMIVVVFPELQKWRLW